MSASTDVLSRRRTVAFADLEAHGSRLAVATEAEVLSYTALAGRVHDAARRLGAVRRLILVAGANELDALVWYLAALTGGHAVMLVPGGDATHLHSWIEAFDPDVVVTPDRTGAWEPDERHEGTAHDLHPDLALVLSTSGSTGSRKLVRLSYENLESNASAIAEYLRLTPDDRAATTLPLHYCYGLSVVHSALTVGAGLVLTDRSVIDPAFWELFSRHGATSLAGVPYTFELLDRARFGDMHLPTLRYVTQAGGRLAPETVRRYAELGARHSWDLYVMYGQTEATARMAYLPPDLARTFPSAVGVPIPGGSIRLDEGELVYSGPNVMLGYAHSPADLARGREIAELRTGDLARQTPEGLYEITGRRGRFAKIYGLRIDLSAVDAALDRAGIAGCSVAGDEELVIAVERDADLGPGRRAVVAATGLPARRIRMLRLPRLPRTDTGKVDLAAVDGAAGSVAPEETAGEDRSACLRTLYAEVLDVSEVTDVTDMDSFASLGGDSLSYVEMSVRLEEALGSLPPDWPTTPIGALRPDVAAGTPPRRRWGHTLETNVALRAIGIVLIVGSHANVFTLLGAAHVLLAAVGYNFARLFLPAASRRERSGRILRATARLAVASVVWIAAVFALTDAYSLANVFLLNTVFGPDTWGPPWRYWFLETVVYLLLAMAALLAVPAVDRTERRFPFAFPAALLALALVPRYLHQVADEGILALHRPHNVLWLFLLGWLAARADGPRRRLMLTAVVAVVVPGLSTAPLRDGLLIVGLLALIWVPAIRVPAFVATILGVLATSSLYIYLTHWQVYPHLEVRYPLLALLASLAVGVLYARVWAAGVRRATPWLRRISRGSPGGHGGKELPGTKKPAGLR